MIFEKKIFTTESSIELKGDRIEYVRTAENFPICRDGKDPDASTFTFSYIRKEEAPAGRPVLFAWNGGPGVSSQFVHVGLIAPEKLMTFNGTDLPVEPPYEAMINDACLLDICDLVLFDPIGTGMSEVYDYEAKRYWQTIDHDADAAVQTIRQWLTRHGRWNSPIYLLGESYGTIRAAKAADKMYASGHNSPSIHAAGIILIGQCLNYERGRTPKTFPKVLEDLPAMACAYYYWHPEAAESMEAFEQECEEFCFNEYVRILALGRRAPEEEITSAAKKINYFTGMPVEKILKDDLIVSPYEFVLSGVAGEGTSIGLYDSRFAAQKRDGQTDYNFSMDPGNLPFSAIHIFFNDKTIKLFGIPDDIEYVDYDSSAERNWDYSCRTTPLEALEAAMHRNINMDLLVISGFHDIMCNNADARNVVYNSKLPLERSEIVYIKSGHMPYMGDDNARFVLENIRKMILSHRTGMGRREKQ